MLADATLDIEVARGLHLDARVGVPHDARGVVAFVGERASLAAACNDRGFATVEIVLPVAAVEVDKAAAWFATAVDAITKDPMLRDRPIGYFGERLAGVAALVAASLHTEAVAAVVTLEAPLALAGTHLSGVRAATLFLVGDDSPPPTAPAVLPPLPAGSMLVRIVAKGATATDDAATDWFDANLRGLMRGARRALWRTA